MTDIPGYNTFRFRELDEKTLVTNEVGKFAVYQQDVIERFFSGELSDYERESFESQSIIVKEEESWKYLSFLKNYREKIDVRDQKLDYLIVIPTLRCDLSCSYCQVSRAPVSAKGFDWDESTISAFEEFVEARGTDGMKVEFQGGEPTLRLDLIERVISICENLYDDCEFVICSNLTNLSEPFIELLRRDNVIVSTSIDGPESTMTENRTFDTKVSNTVLDNVRWIIEEFGHRKIAALPTITENQISQPRKVIDYYRDFGFSNIFLRPVNYQGFARKSFADLSRQVDRWNKFYTEAMEYILEISQEEYFEEFYTAILVRKIFAQQGHGFVDYRSPARYAGQYCVIDFDGKIYPTDESRMLSRTRHVDLCIGTLSAGYDEAKIADLNFNANHYVNEDCTHCAYMPFCGIDIIDDMSRYGRFDIPKHETWFCKRHMFLFDFIFEKVVSWDTRWLRLFNDWIHRSQKTSDAFEIFQ